MPALTLAMIVRDEAEVLGRCLESVRGVMDETVVVDTGSTDDTIAIAERFGCRVEHFAWIDDFAAARNHAFALATSPYILWLDADDVVTAENRGKLLELKSRLALDVYYFAYDYAQDEFGATTCLLQRERIVRNTPAIRWCDPVHEFLTVAGLPGERCDITITHRRTARGAAADRSRNLRILRHASSGSARMTYYLAREYADAGEHEQAIAAFARFLAMPDTWIEECVLAWIGIARAHQALLRRAAAREAAREALRLDPRWADPYVILGQLAADEQQWREAAFWLEQALRPLPPVLSPVLRPMYDVVPAALLCVAWDKLGDVRRANYYNELALQSRPGDRNLLYNRRYLRGRLPVPERISFGAAREGFVHVAESIDAADVFRADDVPAPGETIDAIAFAGRPASAALAEWRRVLRPGGEATMRFEGSANDAAKTLLAIRDAGLLVDRVACDGVHVEARAVAPRSAHRLAFVVPVGADLRAPQLRIRIHHVASWLRANGYPADLVFPDDADGYDTLVFFHAFTADVLRRMRRATALGRRVILDVAEDVLELEFPCYRPMLAAADLVVCCSHRLAERLAPFSRSVAVIEDAVETFEPACVYRDRRRLTIGWMGMTGNERHAERLRPLLERSGATLRTIHGGANADVPWSLDTWAGELAACDVAITPLDVAAQPSKSNNRVTTAMALGLPVIASPLDAYLRVIRDGENGFIASSDGEWSRALELLGDRGARERVGRRARETAARWSIDAIGARWRDLVYAPGAAVDIVIPTRGADEYLEACVASVVANTTLPYRLIVVDAAARAARPALPAAVQWIVPERPLNFAEAVNRGVRAGAAPLVCLLNDDTIVSRGWLEPLVDEARRGAMCNPLSNCDRGWVHDHDLRIGGEPLLPGAHALENGRVVRRGGGGGFPVETLYGYEPGQTRVLEREWLAFFCTAMPREVFARVGMLDEAFASNGEDVDFCRRAARAGVPRRVAERSFVFHFGGVSRALHPEAVDDARSARWLAIKYGQPLVVLHAGWAWEPWTAASIGRSGIGGAETAAARVAAELRRLGNRVVLFGRTGVAEPIVEDGVEYLDAAAFASFSDTHHADVFIASRDARLLDAPMRASRRYLWVHDVVAACADDRGEDRVRRHYASLDAILCLSEWHRQVFMAHHGVGGERIVVTRNGVDVERFAAKVTRQRNRFIYSSSPDRGLDTLLEIFPRIRDAEPGAELHVFYGFDNWERALAAQGRSDPSIALLRRQLEQPGVVYHGRVDQNRLAVEMLKSAVWLYPTRYSETYCITALEMQMAGVVCICSDHSALRTTVGDRGIMLEGDAFEESYRQRAVDAALSILRDGARRRALTGKGRRWAAKQTWASLAADWTRLFTSAPAS